MSESERGAFKFHLVLIALAILIFTVIDIKMVPTLFFGEEPQNVEVGNLSFHPYHFWVMSTAYFTVIFIVALTYWKHTGNAQGARILFAVGAILSLFMVEDILYFVFQGQPIPETYTWLYQAPNIPGQTVLLFANVGLMVSFALIFWYLKKKRLD